MEEISDDIHEPIFKDYKLDIKEEFSKEDRLIEIKNLELELKRIEGLFNMRYNGSSIPTTNPVRIADWEKILILRDRIELRKYAVKTKYGISDIVRILACSMSFVLFFTVLIWGLFFRGH